MSTIDAQEAIKGMKVREILKQVKTSISFEFFPPKTEKSAEELYRAVDELFPLNPTFVSVTYGAGGTTRRLTHELVLKIRKMNGITVVPHLTCVGSTRDEIFEIVGQYRDAGIENIMALRGDPPKGQSAFVPERNGFANATELIRFIRREFPDIGIGAACYPEGHRDTPNRLTEMDYLKEKVDAGVDYLTTQMFFDNHEFFDFKARCDFYGIHVPILAGIMPIVSRKGMVRIAELSPGTRFPAGLLDAVHRVDEENVRKVGIHWATQQVFDLLAYKVDGIHFYTLNKSKPTLEIYRTLGLVNSTPLWG
ncbi:methylenetetrahydrofolate reductase [NAD(P)H] [Salinispira pacifica]